MKHLLPLLLIGLLAGPLGASTRLIHGFITEVTKGSVTVEATNHYGKNNTSVAPMKWTFNENDAYALDNRLVPRQMALKVGRKIYIWGKKGGAFFCVLSEGATHVNGTVKAAADGQVTLAMPFREGTIERSFPLGGSKAPAAGTTISLRPARPWRVEALTAEAAAACRPTNDKAPTLVTAEGWIAKAVETPIAIEIVNLKGTAQTIRKDTRVVRGLIFEANPGKDRKAQLPVGTRVAYYGRPKGPKSKKDHFIATVGPDAGRSEGVIESISGGKLKLKLEGPKGGSTTIDLPKDAVIAIDGVDAKVGGLKPGMRVAVFAARDAVIE